MERLGAFILGALALVWCFGWLRFYEGQPTWWHLVYLFD